MHCMGWCQSEFSYDKPLDKASLLTAFQLESSEEKTRKQRESLPLSEKSDPSSRDQTIVEDDVFVFFSLKLHMLPKESKFVFN